MNRRSYNSHNSSKTQARLARVQGKLQKLRDRVKRSTIAFWERRQTRLTWWQQAFRTPMAGGRWVFSQARTLWAAFMTLLGLSTSRTLRPRSTAIRSSKSHRQSYTRGLMMNEALEKRQLLAVDIDLTVGADVAELIATDPSTVKAATETSALSGPDDTLAVNGLGGNDQFTVNQASLLANLFPANRSGLAITFDGGIGNDTATFAGALADYDFIDNGPSLTVSPKAGSSVDGDLPLTVVNTEVLTFSDTSVRLVGWGSEYATIQSAITAAAVGETIRVAPGTYTENVKINKSDLNLVGPFAGVNANDVTRDGETGEAIIAPLTGRGIFITEFPDGAARSNVSISGFRLITQGQANSAAIWAQGGQAGPATDVFDQISITDNWITSGGQFGIHGNGGNTQFTNWEIADNRFDGGGYENNSAIWFAGSAHFVSGTISGNVILGTTNGLALGIVIGGNLGVSVVNSATLTDNCIQGTTNYAIRLSGGTYSASGNKLVDNPTGLLVANLVTIKNSTIADAAGDGATHPLIVVEDSGTLILENTALITRVSGTNAAGAKAFIAGVDGTVFLDALTTFTIETNQDTAFAIDLDVLTDGGSGTAGSPTNGSLAWTTVGSKYVYTPNADFNGSDSFTFTDGAFSGTVTVNVLPVNDVPTLSVPADTTVSEGATTPALTGFDIDDIDSSEVTATLTLSETPDAAFQGEGAVVDINDFTAGAIAVTESGAAVVDDSTPGVLVISGTPEDVNATVNSLTYSANGDFFGTAAIAVTLVDDDLAAAAPQTLSITVENVNDAPVEHTRDTTDLVNEGARATLRGRNAFGDIPSSSAIELLFTDSDHSPTDVIYEVLSYTNGSLWIGTNTVGNGTEIVIPEAGVGTFTQDDLDQYTGGSQDLRFQHDGSETLVAGFTFRVRDASGAYVMDGGEPAVFTYNFTVNPVNDAPVVTTNTGLTLDEGDSETITNLMLETTDPDNTTTELVYTLTSVPTNGTLFLDGVELLEDNEFTQKDIDDGLLSYEHKGSETISDSFGFSVTDGIIATAVTGTFSITVSPVNNAPEIGGELTVTVSEGNLVTIGSDQLETADSDTAVADLDYTVTTMPANGTIRLGGLPISGPGPHFTQADINSNLVTYLHNGSETTSDSFAFTVSDGELSDSGTFAITVNPVNDNAVLVTNETATVNEGGTVVIGQDKLETTDVDNTPAQITYTVTAGPTNGQLELVSAPGVAISVFTQLQINNEEVVYVHFGSETTSGSFGFSVSDPLGVPITGQAFNIIVIPVNDAPTADNAIDTTDEDTVITFNLLDLVDDVDSTLDGESISVTGARYKFAGDTEFTDFDTLALAGVAYDSDTGVMTFDPTAAGTSNFYQALNDLDEVQVKIDYSVTDGELSADAVVTVTVTGVNDDVELETNNFSVAEGQSFTLTAAQIDAFDVDNDDSDVVVTVTAYGSADGHLRLNGVQLGINNTFTNAQLLNGEVDYLDVSSTANSNTVSISVQDPTGAAQLATLTVTVTEVNDAPVLAGGAALPFEFTEGDSPVDVGTSITVADDEDVVTGATVTITNVQEGDVLAADLTGLGLTQSYDAEFGVLTITGTGSAADYQTALQSVTFENEGDNPDVFGEEGSRTIQFKVNDELSDSNTVSVTVNITAVNDAPVLDTVEITGDPIEYEENGVPVPVFSTIEISDADNQELSGATITITGFVTGEDVFSLGDVGNLEDALAADVVAGAIEIASVDPGTTLTVVLTGVATPAVYAAVLASLTYANSSDDPSTADRTVSFTVSDGPASSAASAAATIEVTAVNDAPFVNDDSEVGDIPTLTIEIRENSNFHSITWLNKAILEVMDLDNLPADLEYTLTNNTRPDLVDLVVRSGGTDQPSGTTFTQADINTTPTATNNIRVRGLGVDATALNNSAELTFEVSDGVATTSVTLLVNIVRVNDAPVRGGSNAAVNTLTVDEEVDGTPSETVLQPTAANPSLLAFTDEEEASEALNYVLITLPDPTHAVLSLNGVDLPAVLSGGVWVPAVFDEMADEFVAAPANSVFFTGQDIVDGNVVYKHVGSAEPDVPGDIPAGALNFTYRVRDNGVGDEVPPVDQPAQTAVQTFTVTLSPQNDSPVAVNDENDVDEDGVAVGGNVLTNDTDSDDVALTVTQVAGEEVLAGPTATEVTLPSGAIVTMLDDGSYTYDPNGKFEWLPFGETVVDSFTYVVSDDDGATDEATVEITITGVNNAPTAEDDTAEVDAGETITVDVLANDTDPDIGSEDDDIDGDVLAVTSVDGTGTTGAVELTVDGEVEYTASGFEALKQGETATDKFSYTINDDNGGTATAEVVVTITGVNDEPTIDATPVAVTVLEEVPTLLAGTFTFDDVDNDAVLTVTLSVGKGSLEYTGAVVVASAPGAMITLTGTPAEVSAAINAVEYTGELDLSGNVADTLTITVADEYFASSGPVEVDINITDVNDAPIPAVTEFTVEQDSSLTVNVLAGASPGPASESDQDLFLISVTNGPDGTASFDPASGTVTYTPTPGFEGVTTFTYTLEDDGGTANGGVNQKIVTVTVTVEDILPVANDDVISVTEGQNTVVPRPNIFTNDISGNTSGSPLVVAVNGVAYTAPSWVTLPSGSQLRIQTDGGIQFISPLAEEIATDTFTYTIQDAQGNESTGTVLVNITDVDDNPTVAAIEIAEAGPYVEGQTVLFSAAGTTDDDIGAVLTYVYSVSPSAGVVIVNNGETADITFPDDGSYTVTVEVSDRGGVASSDSVVIAVSNVKPTIALSGPATINEGSIFTLTLGAITDPGADTVQFFNVNWQDGSFSTAVPYTGLGQTIAHLYQDDTIKNSNGPIEVQLIDEDGTHVGAGFFNLTVINLDPVISSVTGDFTGVAQGGTASFLATASDPGFIFDPLTYAWNFGDGSSTQSGLFLNSVTHVYAEAGSYTLTLTVTDDDGGSATFISTVVINDTIAPTVSLTPDVGSLAIGETALVTITFSEPIMGFDETDLVITGVGQVVAGTLVGSGSNWTVQVEGLAASTGSFTVGIAAASYTDLSGNNGAAGVSSSISVDTARPEVVDIMVASSAWSGSFLAEMGGGYSIMSGGRTLPWVNLDQMILTFSEDVTLPELADIDLGPGVMVNSVVSHPSIANSYLFNVTGLSEGIVFFGPQQVQPISLTLTIASTIVSDTAGNDLASIVVDTFDLVPADFTGDGFVNFADTFFSAALQGTQIGDSQYSVFADFNGDGFVNFQDSFGLGLRQGTGL